jgi:putative transposase
MKKTRFTEEQMVTILREADERPVLEVAKKHGVSAHTIHGWRKHYGTLEPADVRRLRQLEHENGRLKKMVADRDLEIDVLKEITRRVPTRTRTGSDGFRRNPTESETASSDFSPGVLDEVGNLCLRTSRRHVARPRTCPAPPQPGVIYVGRFGMSSRAISGAVLEAGSTAADNVSCA